MVAITSIGLYTTELSFQVWYILNCVSLVADCDAGAVPLLAGLPISRYPPILWLSVISNE